MSQTKKYVCLKIFNVRVLIANKLKMPQKHTHSHTHACICRQPHTHTNLLMKMPQNSHNAFYARASQRRLCLWTTSRCAGPHAQTKVGVDCCEGRRRQDTGAPSCEKSHYFGQICNLMLVVLWSLCCYMQSYRPTTDRRPPTANCRLQTADFQM